MDRYGDSGRRSCSGAEHNEPQRRMYAEALVFYSDPNDLRRSADEEVCG